jgi:hypothetical protein
VDSVVALTPREHGRIRRFAVALDGGPAGDASLTAMLRVATALGGAGGTVSAAAPSDQFKSALRQRLLAAAVAPTSGTSGPGVAVTGTWRRRLVAASTVVAIGSSGVAGTAFASHSALPGEALYGVKRTVETVQLVLATSDVGKGERYLAIAEARLTEVEGLLDLAGPRSTDPVRVEQLRRTLGDLRTSVELARNHFLAAYERTGDARTLLPLEEFLRSMRQELASLSPLLPRALAGDHASLLASLEAIAARLSGTTGRLPVEIPHARLSQPVAGRSIGSDLPSAPEAAREVTSKVTGAVGAATGPEGSTGKTPADAGTDPVVGLDIGGVAGVPGTSITIGGGGTKGAEDSASKSSDELLGGVPLSDAKVATDLPVVGEVEADAELPGAGG